MSTVVFLCVILAAFLHAAWNAMVKSDDDKYRSMTGVMLGHTPFALLAIIVSPTPLAASWPYVLAGAALHIGYQLFLLMSYRYGDLSHVYPIARGVAPVIVALISFLWLGEALSPTGMLAIALIAMGVLSLALVDRADSSPNRKAGTLAIITGLFIAGYSLVDGYGARLAGTALGFYGWLSLVNAAGFVAYMQVWRPGTVRAALMVRTVRSLVAGGASFCAFALVIWGFTQAPIAQVAALREVSIVFAMIIGMVMLREKVSLAKAGSTFITLSGALLLRAGR